MRPHPDGENPVQGHHAALPLEEPIGRAPPRRVDVQTATEQVPTTPTRQFAACFILPVADPPDTLRELKALLEQIGRETSAAMRGMCSEHASLPFAKLGSIHYARIVLIERWASCGPMLVLATDYDGPSGDATCSEARAFERHLDELTGTLRDGLHQLLRHCRGYGALGAQRDYLRAHRVHSRTFFVGAPGRSCAQILWEARLHERVAELAATTEQALGPDARRERIRDQLRADGWALPSFPAQPDLRKKLRRALAGRAALLIAAVGGAVWLLRAYAGVNPFASVACTLALLLLCVLRFRQLERRDIPFQPRPGAAANDQLRVAAAQENEFHQNQLTHLVAIKPGVLRALTIRAVFHGLQLLATYVYNRGTLGAIPSIHFARWVLIPQRGVLFSSNFDSSWQSYLGDFIDKAASGLTAVWSNTVGYPRSRCLLSASARDATRFLAWTRAHQLPTQVWYAAYPSLSIVNINDNTELRRGLADPTCMDARTWQFRLNGIDRAAADELYSRAQTSEPPVPLDRIQGLIVRGYGHMSEARYVMLRVTQHLTPSKLPALLGWFGALDLTSAAAGSRARQPTGPLVNLAFSYQGLRALGVNETLCEGFSTAFVRGAHDPYRARVNGDLDANAPDNWEWGSQANPVHVLLLIFGKTRHCVDHKAQALIQAAEHHGLAHVTTLEGTTLPGRKEHFGFRDGIGQPQVQGFGGSDQEEDAIPTGEFLLGRRDGYGNRTAAPESPNGFSFGFDGSYLVFRQLEQDVQAFWKHCAQRAGGGATGAVTAAARLVGRWPSGASLIRHPDRDPDESRFEDEDDFSYLAHDEDNDRYGARCPFGAHIRRANPRDWNLGATRQEAQALSGLHRIIRRGRPYGPPLETSMKTRALVEAALSGDAHLSDEKRGLQFLCFNANIERQFEHIQQHWCNNPHFAGLNGESDPLLDGRARFVRVVGATYFFMPSIPAVQLLAKGCVQCEEAPPLEAPPPDEQVHVDSLIDTFRSMVTHDYRSGDMRRGAHPKMHGCAKAEFRVLDGLAHELRVGLFAKAHTYRCWVRFSNEKKAGPDIDAAVRGVALKLLDVHQPPKLLDGEEACSTHDFLLISGEAFVTKDVEQFDALVKAIANGSVLLFFLRHPRALLRYLASRKRCGSVLDIPYFSATPYLLGQAAVKYALIPTHPSSLAIPARPSTDYLGEALATRLAHEAVELDFCVQLQHDPSTMPVEDPQVVWKQSDAVFQPVAKLVLLKQDVNTPGRREFGENLAFNPWRCLPEHRPLGGINRARRQVYRALSRLRHARNDVPMGEPSAD